MSQIMHTLRFVIGMSMIAGGAVLAQPFASLLIAARLGQGPVTGVAPADRPFNPPTMMIGAAGHAIPDSRQPPATPGQMAGPMAGDETAVARHADSGAGRGDFAPALPPPPPPAPLPASGLDLSPAVPALEGTYRSTVDIPPPPLLDGHAPPPLAIGWTARGNAGPPAAAPAILPSGGTAEYIVRDGDDLTGIAIKVYGHAAAAAAIWSANRDRLTDPRLLPIGRSLRLPPAWTLPAHGARGAAGGLAIEPALADSSLGNGPGVSVGPEPMAAQARRTAESAWLEGATTATAGP